MPDLSDQHQRDLDDALLELDESLFVGFTVPAPDQADIRDFLAEIGAGEPATIERRDDHLGLYRWAAEGVQARIAADGGSIRFGWRVLAWPDMLLVAQPHAVWQDPDGILVDIAPACVDATETLFAPADSAPTAARYKIVHVSPDRTADIAERVAGLKGGQRAYEERRAAKAGQSLHEWIGVKHFTDPLIAALPAFIAACDAFDAKLPRLPDLIEPRPEDYDEAKEDPWEPAWETELARDRLLDWDLARHEAMIALDDGLDALGIPDTRTFDPEPEEN